MAHSCVEIYLHIIFSTKGRLPLIPNSIENRLYEYLGGIAKKKQIPILNINGMCDHVHLLLKLHPSISLSDLMRDLKSYSTAWLKKNGVSQFNWQECYGAFSCSINHLDRLNEYIDNQKEHHKVKTFDQEIEKLKKYWNIDWQIEPPAIGIDSSQSPHDHCARARRATVTSPPRPPGGVGKE